MKKLQIFSILCIVFVVLTSESCEGHVGKNTADKELKRKTEAAMQEANRQVGMPSIVNFQERKLAKMIFELRDRENFVCHAYLADMNGRVGQYLGECLGYGLPYSVQFTNPQKVVDPEVELGYSKYQGEGGCLTIPQQDPNGLFMPEGLSATWLMLINPKTKKPHPVYVETDIIVSPFKLH